MRTYVYVITIDDSESIMLESALELMITHCQQKIDEGAGAPYWAHKQSAKNVLEKLHDNITQTSGNNFFNGDN